MSLEPDENPLLALLATSEATTVLDEHRRLGPRPPGDDDQPILLQYRQPSLSSLHDNIGKDGEPVHDILRDHTADPVVVFTDESQSAASIPLRVRQGSCASLKEGQLVWKGRVRPSELVQTAIEDDPDAAADANLILTEETTTPQTVLMQQLFKSNQGRWKQMGFDAPDFQELARTASQSDFTHPEPAPPPAVQDAIEEVPESATASALETAGEGDAIPATSPFAKIDDKLTGPPVRAFLLSGDISAVAPESMRVIRQRLRRIHQICVSSLWVDETGHINNLLALLNEAERGLPIRRPPEDVEKLIAEREKLVSERDAVLQDLRRQLEETVTALDGEYARRAAELDNRYQDPATLSKFGRPSRGLIELRVVAQRLLRESRLDEAARCAGEIALLEREERRQAALTMTKTYEADDRRLKAVFAGKREAACARFGRAVEAKAEHFDGLIARIDKRIAKAGEAGSDTAKGLAKASPRRAVRTEKAPPEAFAKTGRLGLAPPKRIQRDNDFQTLGDMTWRLLGKKPPASAAVTAILKETLRVDAH